jgi:hypothetical protein
MLSFSELIAYEPGVIIMGVLCCILFILCGVLLLVSNKGEKGLKAISVIGITFGVLGVITCGACMGYGTIRSGTITPCSISTVMSSSSSCNLVADASETVYEVCNQEASMKLRVNVTRDVVIYERFNPSGNRHTEIVEVKGLFCPSGVATEC